MLERPRSGRPRRNHLLCSSVVRCRHAFERRMSLVRPSCPRLPISTVLTTFDLRLRPLDIKIPKGSLLSPSDTAAVCGGNGESALALLGTTGAETLPYPSSHPSPQFAPTPPPALVRL